MRRAGTLQRTEERVRDLIDGFAGYIETFEGAGLFTGPSLYFHSKTIERLRQHPTATAAINDQLFRETLYATLTSWGLHRMGPGNARLVDFAAFEHGLIQAAPKIKRLASLSITTLRADEVPRVTGDLWAIIHSLKVGVGETRIVSGSKTLHHLLPDLMPPIDREYTIRFFCHHKTLRSDGAEEFAEIYPACQRIAKACESKIRACMDHPDKMHTSLTKVVDNAIVGYVIRRLKEVKE